MLTRLNPAENYDQVYIRTNKIDKLYQSVLDKKLTLHPSVPLQVTPWKQKDFRCLILTIIYLLLSKV